MKTNDYISFIKFWRMNFFKKDIELENRKRLRTIFDKIKVQNCPVGWKYEHFAVGGLTEIGFSEGSVVFPLGCASRVHFLASQRQTLPTFERLLSRLSSNFNDSRANFCLKNNTFKR